MHNFNSQKGIAPVIAILILAVILIGGAYFLKQYQTKQIPTPSVNEMQAISYFTNDSSITAKEEYVSVQKCEFALNPFVKDRKTLFDPSLKKEIVCHFVIGSDLPEYIFRITGKMGDNEIERVDILKDGSNQVLQAFNNFSTYNLDTREFKLQDINFDGYSDVSMHVSYGTIGCSTYDYWIFNPSSKLFDKVDSLGGCNPTPNATTKTISVDNYGPGSAKLIYQWKDGKLILVGNPAE